MEEVSEKNEQDKNSNYLILIVDDDFMVNKILKNTIEKFGYTLFHFTCDPVQKICISI